MSKESRIISVVGSMYALLTSVLVIFLFYFMFKFGRDDISVHILSNIWCLFTLAVLGILYFLRKRQIGDEANELAEMKRSFRNLFLIVGLLAIFIFLNSIWLVSKQYNWVLMHGIANI